MAPADLPSTQSSQSQPSRSNSSRCYSSRRAVLAIAGTATASMLAGCSILGNSIETAAFYDGDWHSYGNGPTNANRVASGAPVPDEHQTLTSAGWPYAPPVVHDGVVYFATDRQVVAIATDGGEQWSQRLDREITGAPREVSGAPALDPDQNRLYVPTRVVRTTNGPDPAPAFVTVFSLTDGNVLHVHRVGDGRTYGVTVFDGDIYVRSATACVRLAPDGTERWRRSLDPLSYDKYNLDDSTATQTAPAVAEDGAYVPDRDALVKLDLETGMERWRVPIDTPYAATVVNDGGVVQTGWQETIAVDHSGDVRWRRDLHSLAAAAATDGDVYVAAGDLHELDAETGETNWQAHLPNEGTAAPVVTDNDVLAAAGGVCAFRRNAGGVLGPDRVTWRTSSVDVTAYSSAVVAAGRVFVVGPTGLLALWPGEDR